MNNPLQFQLQFCFCFLPCSPTHYLPLCVSLSASQCFLRWGSRRIPLPKGVRVKCSLQQNRWFKCPFITFPLIFSHLLQEESSPITILLLLLPLFPHTLPPPPENVLGGPNFPWIFFKRFWFFSSPVEFTESIQKPIGEGKVCPLFLEISICRQWGLLRITYID